jgi:hypothetical protein
MSLRHHSSCKKPLESKHVILNEAKDLVLGSEDSPNTENEILRCAQDDM